MNIVALRAGFLPVLQFPLPIRVPSADSHCVVASPVFTNSTPDHLDQNTEEYEAFIHMLSVYVLLWSYAQSDGCRIINYGR